MSQPRRIAVQLDLQWPYKRHTDVFAGVHRYAREHSWRTIIDEFVVEPASYDGIIARATKSLASSPIPVVNTWYGSPVREQLPGVFPDYPATARLRAEHLLERGFRNFTALFRRDSAALLEATEFQKFLLEAGHPCTLLGIVRDRMKNATVWQKTEEAISAWMDEWELPIGIHVSMDLEGRMLAQMCLERGWRVPEDVGIIAGQNEVAICEQPSPSLTSIEVGYKRIGYKAAELLNELMTSNNNGTNKAAPPRQVLLPPQSLIVRESTDFYSVDDPLVARALAFISANSHRRIGQDDVARAVMSETRTLQSRFRAVLNRPIVTVIRQVRLDRAKRELTQSSRSMSEIARDVGFGRPERMYEVFQRELGLSPTAYRNR